MNQPEKAEIRKRQHCVICNGMAQVLISGSAAVGVVWDIPSSPV